MATPLTDAINALTTYANETTGASDTNLSDAVGTLVAGYGGGGGGVSIIDTITVPNDTRTFNLDFTAYNADFLAVYADVTLSESDWLYFVENGSSPSGGTYTNQTLVNQVGFVFLKLKIMGINETKYAQPTPNGIQLSNTATTNLFVYTYSSGKRIKAGSKFYVIGCNYADLG